MAAVQESHSRTIVKTVVYRILAVLGVMGLSFIFLDGGAATAGTLGLAVLILGTAVYYIHDRIWLWTGWNQREGDDALTRSLTKTVVYRILVIILSFSVIRLFFTENTTTAISFTIAQMALNLVLYFITERIFNKISWGKEA